MSDAAQKPPRMTVDEFIAWAETQPGRHELFMGAVVTMQAEREARNLVKLSVAIAFREALRSKTTNCTTFIDGLAVRVDQNTAFEPDVVVDCGPRNPENYVAPQPVIVVEVASPSTSRIDTGIKFDGYFELASVQHYLIVNTQKRSVTHHRREGERIDSAILHARQGSTLDLDPPGIAVPVADFFADLDAEA